ncbi:LysR family transcriptional regulator [Undibacterium sp. TS12]|uniref:LysR family transcriptional regulator n=1 Tax=Undibacterium sp. TS12 TaxID=2908202 RepID=UPI001F4CFFB2|nr:LysR family transcriptional regulator [Undibacterium sp. TS12]MCH8617889.1 LysR substrate-binding domain-containing protein [Undibacterium sp. TS12]
MIELADMKLFVQAVLSGSLSAAGRELGFSPAVGSKRLSRLEAQLGIRLLQRSSRQLSLTEEGALYFERCQSILGDIANAEAELGQGLAEPRGLLRVSSPVALGRHYIGPALEKFARRHPGLQVQLSLNDHVVDLIASGFDCAIRIGANTDSRLVARKLADNRRVVCASPAYLGGNGAPQTPADLLQHSCILMQGTGAMHADWHFTAADSGEEQSIRVRGNWLTDNGEQAHDWAIAGLGLVRRSIWDVRSALAQGQLIEVLPEWSSNSAPIQAIYPTRRYLPLRTRLFIDLLVQEFSV